MDAISKARLFRLAHDLAISSFGMRQELYEYWHGGDPNRNRINLLRSYDQSDMMDRIKALLSSSGEVPPTSRGSYIPTSPRRWDLSRDRQCPTTISGAPFVGESVASAIRSPASPWVRPSRTCLTPAWQAVSVTRQATMGQEG